MAVLKTYWIENPSADGDAQYAYSPYGDTIVSFMLKDGSVLNVHRNVVDRHYKLSRAVSFSTPAVIDLTRFSRSAGHILIHHLYTGQWEELEWDGPESPNLSSLSRLRTSLEVFAIAQQYLLHSLGDLAKLKIGLYAGCLDTFTIIDAIKESDLGDLDGNMWFHNMIKARLRKDFEDPTVVLNSTLPADLSGNVPIFKIFLQSILEVYSEKVHLLGLKVIPAIPSPGPTAYQQVTYNNNTAVITAPVSAVTQPIIAARSSNMDPQPFGGADAEHRHTVLEEPSSSETQLRPQDSGVESTPPKPSTVKTCTVCNKPFKSKKAEIKRAKCKRCEATPAATNVVQAALDLPPQVGTAPPEAESASGIEQQPESTIRHMSAPVSAPAPLSGLPGVIQSELMAQLGDSQAAFAPSKKNKGKEASFPVNLAPGGEYVLQSPSNLESDHKPDSGPTVQPITALIHEHPATSNPFSSPFAGPLTQHEHKASMLNILRSVAGDRFDLPPQHQHDEQPISAGAPSPSQLAQRGQKFDEEWVLDFGSQQAVYTTLPVLAPTPNLQPNFQQEGYQNGYQSAFAPLNTSRDTHMQTTPSQGLPVPAAAQPQYPASPEIMFASKPTAADPRGPYHIRIPRKRTDSNLAAHGVPDVTFQQNEHRRFVPVKVNPGDGLSDQDITEPVQAPPPRALPTLSDTGSVVIVDLPEEDSTSPKPEVFH
ncbi:hypothetical protein QBC35DRAFT_462492 [Podospora australis]|uniref:BTB domain-containing protein n=1 Tax=Podospora australis TaxID=1536484 RepID=A0AAN6WVA2_9PEZI|nr:hypothetical protein QBC35DRAFT_462492 [Podospora australis]